MIDLNEHQFSNPVDSMKAARPQLIVWMMARIWKCFGYLFDAVELSSVAEWKIFIVICVFGRRAFFGTCGCWLLFFLHVLCPHSSHWFGNCSISSCFNTTEKLFWCIYIFICRKKCHSCLYQIEQVKCSFYFLFIYEVNCCWEPMLNSRVNIHSLNMLLAV